MNDFNVSNANTYSRPVQFGNDPQNVNSVDVSGIGKIGGPSVEGRGVTMTRAVKSEAPLVGSDKHALVAPERPASLSEINESSDAVGNFLEGMKQKDDENVVVNKSELLAQRKKDAEEKKVQGEVIAYKVLSECGTVSDKSEAVALQMDTQAKSLAEKNAAGKAQQVSEGRNEVAEGFKIAFQVLGTVMSATEGFCYSSAQRAIAKSGSLTYNLAADVAQYFQVSRDSDESMVQANQDSAYRAGLQHVSSSVQGMAKLYADTSAKAQEALDEIMRETREAEKQMTVAAS